MYPKLIGALVHDRAKVFVRGLRTFAASKAALELGLGAGLLVAIWSPCDVARAHELEGPAARSEAPPTDDAPSEREEKARSRERERDTSERSPRTEKQEDQKKDAPAEREQRTERGAKAEEATEPADEQKATEPKTDEQKAGGKGTGREREADASNETRDEQQERSAETRTRNERDSVEGAETTTRSLEPMAPLGAPLVEQTGGNRITLEQAIELALRNHPAIAEAEFRIEAAQTRVGQAQASYYPQIDGWLEYVRATENGSPTIIHSVPGLARVGGSTPEGVGTFDSFNNYLAAVVIRQMIYDSGRTAGAVDAERGGAA